MNGFNDLRPEIAYLPSKDEDGNPAALRCDLTSIGYSRDGALLPASVRLYRSEIDAKRAGGDKRGVLHRSHYESFSAWESAVAGVYGGVTSQWPQWAKNTVMRERNYL